MTTLERTLQFFSPNNRLLYDRSEDYGGWLIVPVLIRPDGRHTVNVFNPSGDLVYEDCTGYKSDLMAINVGRHWVDFQMAQMEATD